MEDTCDTEKYFSCYYETFDEGLVGFKEVPECETSFPISEWTPVAKLPKKEMRNTRVHYQKYKEIITERMICASKKAACMYSIDQKELFTRMQRIRHANTRMTQKIVAAGTLYLALRDYNIDIRMHTLCEVCEVSTPTARKARSIFSK